MPGWFTHRDDGTSGSAWLVAVLRSLGEQVSLPRDELLNGFGGSASDFLQSGSHSVIPILAM
jgi:hypothetical protein